MSRVLVSGLINIETTLKVDGFPIPYFPVRYPFHGVNSTVSGVGYNIAKALITLGCGVSFLSIIGKGMAAQQVQAALEVEGIPADNVLSLMPCTAQSVILYDPQGRRQINVDLKDIGVKSKGGAPLPGEHGFVSDREKQVFLMVIQGNTTAEIADILCISPKTVEKHRENISKKLGTNNPLEMVKYAVKAGIIDSETLDI